MIASYFIYFPHHFPLWNSIASSPCDASQGLIAALRQDVESCKDQVAALRDCLHSNGVALQRFSREVQWDLLGDLMGSKFDGDLMGI